MLTLYSAKSSELASFSFKRCHLCGYAYSIHSIHGFCGILQGITGIFIDMQVLHDYND
jgi:hypothetical protein